MPWTWPPARPPGAQVLDDGTNRHLYGLGRIGTQTPAGVQYHHGDAIGSLRMVTGSAGGAGGQASYSPFGVPLPDSDVGSAYGFAGEWTHATGVAPL